MAGRASPRAGLALAQHLDVHQQITQHFERRRQRAFGSRDAPGAIAQPVLQGAAVAAHAQHRKDG